MPYRIEFTDDAREHLKHLTARDRSTLTARLREQLTHEPRRETRNRKRLHANPLAPWALRIGHLRVYYGVSAQPEAVVTVRAIGIKRGSRVVIGGEEMDLS